MSFKFDHMPLMRSAVLEHVYSSADFFVIEVAEVELRAVEVVAAAVSEVAEAFPVGALDALNEPVVALRDRARSTRQICKGREKLN